MITASFLGIYGVTRFFCEFFREPDMQLGPVLGPFTLGQLLCLLMSALGGVVAVHVFNRQNRLST